MPYIGLGPEEGTVVDDDKAFRYALERCVNGTKDEREEFVKWYYSGNWYKEEEE